MMRALLLCTALALSVPASSRVHAAEPTGDPDARSAAEQLHAQALDAFKKGDRPRAVALWRSANTRHPFWKYAYNIANALYLDGAHEEAWTFLEEARATMHEHLAKLDELDAKLSLELAKTHAWLQVRVMPEDAVVKRNGSVWRAPRRVWTKDTESRLEIASSGYEPLAAVVVTHAIGQRTTEEYMLTPIARGELVVTGTPAGAVVRIGEVTVGALPKVGPVVLAPGQYEVMIDDPEYLPLSARVEIVNGGVFELPVALRNKPKFEPGLSSQQTIGVVVGGVGVLTAALVGGLLLSAADDKAQAMRELNGNEADLVTMGGYAEYRRRYDALDDDHDAFELSGAIAVGVGAAAVATGVVMLITGGKDGPPETKARVNVGAGASPLGATATWSF